MTSEKLHNTGNHAFGKVRWYLVKIQFFFYPWAFSPFVPCSAEWWHVWFQLVSYFSFFELKSVYFRVPALLYPLTSFLSAWWLFVPCKRCAFDAGWSDITGTRVIRAGALLRDCNRRNCARSLNVTGARSQSVRVRSRINNEQMPKYPQYMHPQRPRNNVPWQTILANRRLGFCGGFRGSSGGFKGSGSNFIGVHATYEANNDTYFTIPLHSLPILIMCILTNIMSNIFLKISVKRFKLCVVRIWQSEPSCKLHACILITNKEKYKKKIKVNRER